MWRAKSGLGLAQVPTLDFLTQTTGGLAPFGFDPAIDYWNFDSVLNNGTLGSCEALRPGYSLSFPYPPIAFSEPDSLLISSFSIPYRVPLANAPGPQRLPRQRGLAKAASGVHFEYHQLRLVAERPVRAPPCMDPASFPALAMCHAQPPRR